MSGSAGRLAILLLPMGLIWAPFPVSAQGLVEIRILLLTDPPEGMADFAMPPWGEPCFVLDQLRMEVIAFRADGEVAGRYGGWGTGSMALDFPLSIEAAENSLFVLDQGRRQILRLDPQLNPVAITPLPAEHLPVAFVRDTQQRFWVSFENRAGVLLIDDRGTLLDVIGDERSGGTAVHHPALLAPTAAGTAVWDEVNGSLFLYQLSGRLLRQISLPDVKGVLDMAVLDVWLFLLTSDGCLAIDTESGRTRLLAGCDGVISIVSRSPYLYGLHQEGKLLQFQLQE